MLTVMKYEIRKHAFYKIIILILFAILELLILGRIFLGFHNEANVAYSLLAILSGIAAVIFSFEPIVSFSTDLDKKSGYLLYLTPNSTYKIVTAKWLAAMMQIIMVSMLFSGFNTLNNWLLRISQIKINAQILDTFISTNFLASKDCIHYIFNIPATVQLINNIFIWGIILAMGFLSISISKAILPGNKIKNIFSFIIFSLIIYFVICSLDKAGVSFGSSSPRDLIKILYSIIICGGLIAATTWIMDKKISI